MTEQIHRKRCKRIDAVGDAHFLTFSCYGRIPLFSKDRTCWWMLDALNRGRQKGLFDLWAYVIMPEHVHVVLYPLRGARVQDILRTIKQPVALRARNWLSSNAPQYLYLSKLSERSGRSKPIFRFWQRGGGYDRNLRSEADVHEKIDYVHANPVRRGLAIAANAWLWSSCRAWETGEDVPIPIDRSSVPVLHT